MTTVYRHYNADGDLLYVGCTDHIDQRTKQHKCSSSWRNEIARIEEEHFDSRVVGGTREIDLIQQLKPRYNKSSARCSRYGTSRESRLGTVREYWEAVCHFDRTGEGDIYIEDRRSFLDRLRTSKYPSFWQEERELLESLELVSATRRGQEQEAAVA